MFYTSEPDALRAFLRDKLGFPFTDVGDGWLIFDLPDAEMGCHPADPTHGGKSGTHSISFYCDDVETFVGEFVSKDRAGPAETDNDRVFVRKLLRHRQLSLRQSSRNERQQNSHDAQFGWVAMATVGSVTR